MSKRTAVLGLLGLVALAGSIYGAVSWRQTGSDGLPEGIVSGNGRMEADQVDVAARLAGRVREIAVAEGDMVAAGELVAAMDTAELEAAHDRAEAETALAREQLAEAEAVVIQRRSELRLAERELERARTLVQRGNISESTLEDRETARDVAAATQRAAQAAVHTAERRIVAQAAEARRIQTLIDDSRLVAPVEGRVLYRLVEPGEVVAGGDALVTLLSLENVYMEVFLPADAAARVAIRDEARIVLDVLPEYAIPAFVSFVSPEAQFTPKQVETLSEREKLVFRVRVKVPPDLVRSRIEHVKTGVRGVAYVKLSPSLSWPESLNRRIPADLFR